MRVFGYHHSPNDPNFPTKLIALWKKSWTDQGFKVTLLDEMDCISHPRYEELDKLVSSFPTVNDKKFERSCWLRWLAYSQNAPGVFCDYDVINFGLKPTDFVPTPLIVLDESLCGAFYAIKQSIDNFIDFFPQALSYVRNVNGQDHISDAYLFEKWFKGEIYGNLGRLVGHDGDMTAPLVHFSNGYVKEGQKFNDRDKAVRELAAKRGVTFPE